MWIMTPDGILMPAAVPARLDGYATNPEDWDMQVRARDRKVLAKTRKAMQRRGWCVSKIIATLGRDYEYRMYVHSENFGVHIAELIAEIDYEKFKPVSLEKGRGGRGLHNLYNALWYAVARHYDSPILGRYSRTPRRTSRENFE